MAKPCRNTGLSRARPPVNAEGATDYLFRGFFFGSTRVGLGGGACKAGRAWGNMADAPPPPIPHAQGFSIRRTLIDLARFLLGSDSYAGGEGYCKSGRISTDEVGLETSSRREPRPLRQRRWLQFCSHFKRVLPERTVRGRSNPHIADPLNP